MATGGFADQNLLFGMLARREKLVGDADLLDALAAWSDAPYRSVADVLRERGKLTPEQQCLVETQVEAHLSSLESPPTVLPTTQPQAPPALRYAAERLHRCGGLGEVWSATDSELGRRVALKQIREELADRADFRDRFVREARITGSLEHPGVVPVYGLGTYADGRPFYAMRFVEGRTLTEVIRAHHRDGTACDTAERALAFRDLLGYFVCVCNTVAYAHSRRVLHRDLKPENVLIGPYGETLVVDWGLARAACGAEAAVPTLPGQIGHSVAGMQMGTKQYMAPEQYAGRLHEIDERTDVYLLGGILFEILTGQPPHPKEWGTTEPSARAVNPAAPAALDAIAAKALCRPRGERYATAADLADEVRRWLADEPVVVYRDLVAQLRQRAEQSQDVREALARNRVALALVLIGLRRHAEAETALREAVADYDVLVTAYPRLSRYRSERAVTRVHLGNVLATTARPEEARQEHEAATREYAQLIATAPDDYCTNVASVMLSLAGLPPSPAGEDRPAPAQAGPRTDNPFPTDHPLLEGPDVGPATLAPSPQESAQAAAAVGSPVLRSHFELVRLLGVGGMSQVFLARDPVLERQVAIKTPYHDRGEVERRQHLLEARIVAQLDHPNIVPAFSFGERADGKPFIVLKHLDGLDLYTAIHRSSKLDVPRLLRAFVGVCRAIAYAHRRGVIHRDPKPRNVILTANGAVVMDWGLSHVGEPQPGSEPIVVGDVRHEWAVGQVAGTPAYLSPQAARGERPTPASDVYVLGAGLFQMLTGRLPRAEGDAVQILDAIINSPTPRARSVDPSVPRPLDAVCAKAMAYDPADRYASADDLADDVERWLAGDSVSAFRRPLLLRPAYALGRLIERLRGVESR